MQKSSISFRIGTDAWMSDRRFEDLLNLLDKYQGVTDQVTFFSSSTHSPLSLEDFSYRMTLLKKRMEQTRARGYQTGINILSTIGHHEENLEHSLQGQYTYVTDISGRVSRGSYCPNDRRFREYIRNIYRFAVQANPDYIWIDDDIRLAGHMPVGFTCFCDNCLSIFETETQMKWSRTQLAKVFASGNQKDKLRWREAWLNHNRNTINRLFLLIESEVHSMAPDMILGFMTGDRFYEGYDFDRWARTLSGNNRAKVWWRPGGGYYQDGQTAELAGKSHDIGRQVAMLPPEVSLIQAEIENFPYQRLKKAASITALEAASHIAAGCTGVAFNVLSFYDEPLDEYEPLLQKLKNTRPFLDRLVAELGDKPLDGASVVWDRSSFITVRLQEDWPGSANPVIRPEQYDIGIPACYNYGNATITMLTGNNIYTLNDSAIRKLLSGAVYMDVPALEQLNKLGYGALTGFEVSDTSMRDRIEQFTHHSINMSFAGRKRDNRQSFYREAAYGLRPVQPGAETLAYLVDYSGKKQASATMGLFENTLGGRICVAGYYPWSYMGSQSKSAQIKNIFRWLGRDRLPGYIASFHKANCWIRNTGKGKVAMAVTNSSFDPALELTVMLRSDSDIALLYDMNGEAVKVKASGSDGVYRKFVVPKIAPWEMVLIVSGP
ncbi:MAG: hypothetical protein KF862_26925 [Chitinophagaceae bacterium]|nr:hypothetical protein [Chitinophagaceae bacterium]